MCLCSGHTHAIHLFNNNTLLHAALIYSGSTHTFKYDIQPSSLQRMTPQHEQFMHLTNYSINKHSERFDTSEEYDKGSKRTIKYFNGWLTHNGYNVGEMWARIHVREQNVQQYKVIIYMNVF